MRRRGAVPAALAAHVGRDFFSRARYHTRKNGRLRRKGSEKKSREGGGRVNRSNRDRVIYILLIYILLQLLPFDEYLIFFDPFAFFSDFQISLDL